jgi:hypothetical protein
MVRIEALMLIVYLFNRVLTFHQTELGSATVHTGARNGVVV